MYRLISFLLPFICLFAESLNAQLQWQNVDSLYQPLPPSVHVFMTQDSLDGRPNIAYYLSAELKDRSIDFTVFLGNGKRYTPSQYYEREQNPLVVMNCTFFEFTHNSNLNVVIRDHQLLSYQVHTLPGKGKDTLTYRHMFGSAFGINKKREADIAWLYTDTGKRYAYASQQVITPYKDSLPYVSPKRMGLYGNFGKWKMQTAVGGGPVLLQDGLVKITNNEEGKFGGKAIQDKHPRTAMGYTAEGKLILLVIQGRFPSIAEGATLTQEAEILKQLGCWEALNLDGGGSSCMLINGKPTITPSDKEGQRPVPAVFIIQKK